MSVIYNLRSGKNTKAFYYMRCVLRQIIPSLFYRLQRNGELRKCEQREDIDYMRDRVDYYNKLQNHYVLDDTAKSIRELRKGGASSSYFYDTVEIARWFQKQRRISIDWGDVTYIPKQPSIVKSRPIDGDNANSVVLKLDKIRHFLFVKDSRLWHDKNNRVIFRGKVPGKEKRIRFFNMYFGNPMCDLGDTSRNGNIEWQTGKRTLEEQLKFKFILALEGNDVASNLKWIMSSGSIAIMPRPEYETWFMEGRLIPNVHYIEIKRDFSDLEERINYYLLHESESLAIIRNANEYVAQFMNPRREKLISLMVLNKYLSKTE
ncbi:MAG: glycosyl transferase family 90 [Muribaculaceae bacterium]